jgi:hypothetical protein
MTTKGGEKQMQQPWLALALAQERQDREAAHAAAGRRAGRPIPSIRRAIGHRIIAIGARVAAEPPLELARSR